jgi:hypothetical protein
MRDEDKVVISKGQWNDYLAYNLFSINFEGIVFDIKIEPKNIVKLEKLIELKKKQGAIKELSAVVLLIDAIMDIDDMQGLKNTIQKWITDLEEGVEHE